MKTTLVGACVALAFTAAVSAQDKKMAMKKMDQMAMEKTYSGCLESSQTGSFTLTHSMIADSRKSMKTAAPMKTDDSSMKTDMTHDAMAHDGMAPVTLALSAAASSVNLNKHVGRKVTVTGTEGDNMNGMPTFNVKSLRVINASCS